MGEAGRKRAYVRENVSEVGQTALREASIRAQHQFGPEYETLVCIFARRKDDAANVRYFSAMEIPDLVNLVSELSRAWSTAKILGKIDDKGRLASEH